MRRKFTEGLLNESIILDNLAIQTGQIVLDAGCGTGYMAKVFAGLVGKSGKVYALDSDSIALRLIQAELEITRISVTVGDITKNTGLKDHSLDLVYLSTVFHIFKPDQIKGFVNEMRRVLKPGARLAIVTFNKEDVRFGPPLEYRLTPDELAKALPFIPGAVIDVGSGFYMRLFKTGQS